MKPILTSAAVLALGLAVAGFAEAGGPKSGGGGGAKSIGGSGSGSNYSPTNLSFKPGQNQGGSTSPTKLTTLKPTYTGKDYNTKYGTKCSFGYCYKGYKQCHWSYCCWWASYGCYCYWDPCCSCYYYFCTTDDCWYPVSYCPYGTYTFDD